VQAKLIQFICVNLFLSALIGGKKKRISLATDDKGLTLIYTEVEKKYMNNFDADRFGIRLDGGYEIA